MNREEAKIAEKEGKVTAGVLLRLTDSVFNDVVCTMQDYQSEASCADLLEELEDEKGKEVFLDKVFEALQECFTLPELKILDRSNEDSANYQLMYKKLSKHFYNKMVEEKSYNGNIGCSVNTEETYEIVFRGLSNLVPAADDRLDMASYGRGTNFNKIQEKFQNRGK